MTTPLPENCVPLLLQAARLGLSIEIKDSQTLTVIGPTARLTPEFVDLLRIHKWHLLSVLSWPFVMVDSEALGTVLFCEDEDTKSALIEAGADEWSIYTKAELAILAEHKRVAPFTPDELRKVHEIKRTFNARITPQ